MRNPHSVEMKSAALSRIMDHSTPLKVVAPAFPRARDQPFAAFVEFLIRPSAHHVHKLNTK
jgi:hypothetical protein